MDSRTAEIISKLGLRQHHEGGYYAEFFRSPLLITLPDGRCRAAGTLIYFLLPWGDFSSMHRVASDETWHYYDGLSVRLTLITPDGVLNKVVLGRDDAAGEKFHHVVPAGVWQAAEPCGVSTIVEGFSLAGCGVAPGFDFEDFEMPGRKALQDLFPQHALEIDRLTRPQ